jgi:hypothetical protein
MVVAAVTFMTLLTLSSITTSAQGCLTGFEALISVNIAE